MNPEVPETASHNNTEQLHTVGLVKSYRRRRVVNGVSVTIGPGEIVGLLGPNGAGKTTTFYLTIGFIKPESGDVRLGDRVITRLPMYRRARLGIGYLPQEPSIFRKLTVTNNILAVLEVQGLSRRQRKQRLGVRCRGDRPAESRY